MITKELLHKNRDYKIEHMKELHLGSTPNPMFLNGEFNEDNWNSGDGVIRQFLSEIECGDTWTPVFKSENTILTVKYKIDDVDTHHVTIVVDKESSEDRYYFSWYKHRGRTEVAIKNRKILTEDSYLELLNIIEDVAGFKFRFYK